MKLEELYNIVKKAMEMGCKDAKVKVREDGYEESYTREVVYTTLSFNTPNCEIDEFVIINES